MVAVYFADESLRCWISGHYQDHAAPRTGSDTYFEVAVEDEARSVCPDYDTVNGDLAVEVDGVVLSLEGRYHSSAT